jgi:hypothetical protein
LRNFPVEINGQTVAEPVRMIPGHKHPAFEEELQSAWLYETLRPHVDELVVAGIRKSRGPKNDGRDAHAPAEKLTIGNPSGGVRVHLLETVLIGRTENAD